MDECGSEVRQTEQMSTSARDRERCSLVQEWTELHRDELVADWERAEREEPLASIEPLP